MKILVINCGSSSLKYQLFDMESEKWLAKGICEAIGTSTSAAKGSTPDGKEFKMTVDIPDHKVAFNIVKDALTTGECKVIDDLKEIDAVGHRVVQGGDRYTESILIDNSVVKALLTLVNSHLFTTLLMLLVLTLVQRFSAKNSHRLLYLTTHSTAQCLKPLICSDFLTNIMKNTMFVVTVLKV
ncbi:MAG: hypothetical protein J6Q87_00295 [Clostridia bacterium]|nr:hypothetical protein [Clostridia bacterium]